MLTLVSLQASKNPHVRNQVPCLPFKTLILKTVLSYPFLQPGSKSELTFISKIAGSHFKDHFQPPFINNNSLHFTPHLAWICLSLPRDSPGHRFQFILHCSRRIFLKGIGEVSLPVLHKVMSSFNLIKAFLKPTADYFLNGSSHYPASYLHSQILPSNHIRNHWQSPSSLCPLVPLYFCTS